MPRLTRYLLIWLSCTAASVTAVMLTVYFVIGLTRPTPPAARSVQAVFPSPSVLVGAPASASAGPQTPTASPARPSVQAPQAPRTPSPSPTRAASPSPAPRPSAQCSGGPGRHTVPSQGGKVTVQYGRTRVCFVSAVPDPGFRTSTQQTDPDTLVVVFTSDGHRSTITATVVPTARASVRETRL
ncbi:hypothetical protein [Streptomyces bambusae]|uniref:hypothetical protein n=1 Tax=Streptomyces bambusae TaxID=1550616 RepID=UPI0021F645F5|nr:hypothetical protein [Streptomyces bambusae]